jgi:hypothetical protein
MPAVLSSRTFLLSGNRASSTARPQQHRQLGDVGGDASGLVASEAASLPTAWSRVKHLFRNVPTFGRLGVFARALGRVPWRVAIMPDGPSYRIGARRAAAVTSVATPPQPPLLPPTAAAAAAALRELEAASQCSSSLIVENIKRRQADVGDFLLTQSDFVTHFGFRRQHIRCRLADCGGRSACQRQ